VNEYPGQDDGRSLQMSSSDQHAANERATLIAFLTVRSMHLIAGGVSVATGWRSYTRPRLALATLCASLLESAWLARRCWRRQAYDEAFPALVDTGCGLVGLVAIAAATTPEDRTTWLNWVCPLTFGTAAGVAVAVDRRTATAWPVLLAGTYVATVVPSMRMGGSQVATAVANTTSYANYFVAAHRFIRRLRRDARQLETARQETLRERERLATEQERNRQHRLLHDSVLQTLEAVAGPYDVDLEAIRRQARREATTLRRAISGDSVQPVELSDNLEGLSQEFAERGLQVDLVVTELVDEQPASPVVTALCEATREALINVLKHSGVTQVVVRASSEPDGTKITIRDQGDGFDLTSYQPGFGIANSLISRLADVGGRAELWSEPGQGTRVELWTPR
jgi:signal transduction histidine kinase